MASERIEKFRAFRDNVLIALLPLPAESASGIALVHGAPKARDSREAVVVASGPGYYRNIRRRLANGFFTEPTDVFIPNETKPGDRVLVDHDAGQNYEFDLSIPRHNFGQNFEELLGERRDFRIIREDEVLCIIERDEAQAAE